MLNYPIERTLNCKYCGAVVTAVRQGDGRPLGDRLNYYYSSDHTCVESRAAIQAMLAERHVVYGGIGCVGPEL